MKWIVKAAVQQILAAMPARVADPIYHGLQQYVRGIHVDIKGQRRFIEEVALLLEDIRGKTLSGLRIVELGSGWFPVLPLLLVREFGVASVQTFDVNQHYSSARIATAAREIMETVMHLREDPVLKQTALTGHLPDSIHYYPRTRIQHILELRSGLAELALSRSALEYIAPEDIRDIHSRSVQWLTPDALWIHLVATTSDERARQDRKLHQLDFLRYSEKEWSRISGNRYAYKNRLRLPQYRSLFQSAGWHVERERASISESTMATLNRVSLHPDFGRFSPEELIADSIRFALVRANA